MTSSLRGGKGVMNMGGDFFFYVFFLPGRGDDRGRDRGRGCYA